MVNNGAAVTVWLTPNIGTTYRTIMLTDSPCARIFLCQNETKHTTKLKMNLSDCIFVNRYCAIVILNSFVHYENLIW